MTDKYVKMSFQSVNERWCLEFETFVYPIDNMGEL